jgi:trehalose/maltose hydrolase-like predicted phosphorylase
MQLSMGGEFAVPDTSHELVLYANPRSLLSSGTMLQRLLWTAATLPVLLRVTLAVVYDTRFPNTTWDDTNWRLITTNLDQGHYQSRISLANGYLGINVAAVGPFFEPDSSVAGDDISGWPLFDRRQTFATISGFFDSQPRTNGTNFEWLYQYGWDSAISGVPHWAGLHVATAEGDVLNASVQASQISNFSSSWDYRAGTFTWNYTWTPSNGEAIDVEYTMLVHKLYVNQAAVRLKLTPVSKDMKLTIIDVLNGDCALRTNATDKAYEPKFPLIYSAVNPLGLNNITAYIYSALIGDNSNSWGSRFEFTDSSVIGGNDSSIAQAFSGNLAAGKTATVTKYIGGASSDAFSNPREIALEGAWNAAHDGFDCMLKSHTEEWQSIATEDKIDSYRFPENGTLPNSTDIIELQILAVTNTYYLLQNTIGANAIAAAGNNTKLNVNSISVGGLTSDSYAGQIFWDAEVWMAPGLVVTFPQAAQQIANYRVEKFPQAQANVLTAYQSSQNQTGKFSEGGAVYSWTSGRYGNCTGTGPCFDYEYHINGDIGLELYNYYVATGDTQLFKERFFPIYDAIAQFYSELVTYNETTGKYDLYNATDPDEYANFQTNVGYTMVLMKTHIDTANKLRARFGLQENATWANISSLIEVPVNQAANIILEYQAMNNSVAVKQADVILVDDFLDFPNPYSLSDLDYYAGKQSPNGPGMTYGVFSIVANEISPSGCSSYTYDLASSQPYVRGPWFQFSEQLIDNFEENGGTHPAYPFLTGHGGSHRVAIFGYLGLRLMQDSLNVDPSLPPQIPHLDYRTFYWQGWPINATSNQTHTTLTRLPTPLENANSTFTTSAIPVTIGINGSSSMSGGNVHQLPSNGILILPNRQVGLNKTVGGNIAQCQPASSKQAYEPGQFPLAAVDGAVSTSWQPAQANISSSFTVELPEPFVPVTGIQFEWAQAPPVSYSVTFSNDTDASAASVNVTSSENVAISIQYDAATAEVIKPYTSNSTNVTLSSPVYSGKYATLTIAGNQALAGTPNEKNGTGATVAEFVIVAADGSDLAKRHLRAWTG